MSLHGRPIFPLHVLTTIGRKSDYADQSEYRIENSQGNEEGFFVPLPDLVGSEVVEVGEYLCSVGRWAGGLDYDVLVRPLSDKEYAL